MLKRRRVSTGKLAKPSQELPITTITKINAIEFVKLFDKFDKFPTFHEMESLT